MCLCEVDSYDHQVGCTFSSISCRWPVLMNTPQLQLRSSFLAAFLAFLAWIVLCLYIVLETCLDSCKQKCSEKCTIASFFAFFSIFLIQEQYWFWQNKWMKKRYARGDCLMDSSEQARAARFLQLFCFFLIILHHPISPKPSKGSTQCNKQSQQHENLIPLCCDDSIYIHHHPSTFKPELFLSSAASWLTTSAWGASNWQCSMVIWPCPLENAITYYTMVVRLAVLALDIRAFCPWGPWGPAFKAIWEVETARRNLLNLHLWIWSLFLNSSCQRLSHQTTAIQHSCSCNCGWTITAVKSIKAVNGWLESTAI